jgi:hypothetical protein
VLVPNGQVLVAEGLSRAAIEALGLQTSKAIRGLTDAHRANLARHRLKFGFQE